MPELLKFLVIVEAVDYSGFAITSAEGIVKPTGFFTTRFVQATGAEQAGQFALEIVQHEVASRAPLHPCTRAPVNPCTSEPVNP